MPKFARMTVLVLIGALGCSGSVWVQKGDTLLSARKYDEAVEAYEQALNESPRDEAAKAGIARARREHALEVLLRAEEELEAGRFVLALRSALEARAMPLDLDDVKVGRRIDRTIAKISLNADSTISGWLEDERFLDAVALSDELIEVDPSRESYAAEVRTKAVGFFQRGAQAARSAGFPGTAAVRLSIAADLGAPVRVDEVEALWATFRGPNCFADPTVRVRSKRRLLKELDTRLHTAALRPLKALQSRCGVGEQPLKVILEVTDANTRDDRSFSSAFEPLPGVEIQTEEVYFEETPYVDTEEVTTYETKVETIEHRDCAPRPGQRGCRTWTEEVKKQVPKTEIRDVRKVRRVRKTRPIRKPPPAEKVVRFRQESAMRAVTYEGAIRIGDVPEPVPFAVRAESSDTGHGPVNDRGVVLPADPVEIESLEAVLMRADRALESEMERAIVYFVQARSALLEEQAVQRSQAGEREAAEESYLASLVIGGAVDAPMTRFFDRRYGRPVPEVMTALLRALGRAPPRDDVTPDVDGYFPEGDDPRDAGAGQSESGSASGTRESQPVRPESTDEDLEALREASIEAAEAQPERREEDESRDAEDAGRPARPEQLENSAPVVPSEDDEALRRAPVRPNSVGPVVPLP